MESKSILVVGAGFSGCSIAYELAQKGFQVTVIDQRDHIGGNAFDYINEIGLRIHKYGPHLFHTNNKLVFDWLSQFTDWIEYKHKVVAKLPNSQLIVFPPTKSFVDKMGKEFVFNTLYVPYTSKMWNLSIEEIDDGILQRVPLRKDDCDLYFPNDKYQFLPKFGYTKLIENILAHTNIKIFLNTKFDHTFEKGYYHVFNSMPIDCYYNYRYGELPYRSIKFNIQTLDIEKLSNHPVINFTTNSNHTRMVEWKNLPNCPLSKMTTVTYETPCDYKDNNLERYYPVKDAQGINKKKYIKYSQIKNKKTTFIGRCGLYVYINMDQAIASSLAIAKKFIQNESIA